MNITPIHPSKTGLDARFEDELASSLPDWRPDPATQVSSTKTKTQPARESTLDRKIEESMILGR